MPLPSSAGRTLSYLSATPFPHLAPPSCSWAFKFFRSCVLGHTWGAFQAFPELAGLQLASLHCRFGEQLGQDAAPLPGRQSGAGINQWAGKGAVRDPALLEAGNAPSTVSSSRRVKDECPGLCSGSKICAHLWHTRMAVETVPGKIKYICKLLHI